MACKILIQKRSFSVPNMQISRRFWWKTGDNFSFRSICQIDFKRTPMFTSAGLSLGLVILSALPL